jgi:hypothetical protein
MGFNKLHFKLLKDEVHEAGRAQCPLAAVLPTGSARGRSGTRSAFDERTRGFYADAKRGNP